MSTGNWCFKDGVITFQDIYNLYLKHFRGKRLGITSDCSYSGNWVSECAKVYDEQGILPCGHHSRERGLLINIFTSCQAHQQATILAYVKEGMQLIVKDVIFHSKTLSSRQTTINGDFQRIYCNYKPREPCQYTSTNATWENMMLHQDRVFVVHSKDKGEPTWYYVLVDNDKTQQFKDALSSNAIHLTEYGKILDSGYGVNPPNNVDKNIKQRFGIQ